MPLAMPLAWWLVRSSSPARSVVEAVVALPLVCLPLCSLLPVGDTEPHSTCGCLLGQHHGAVVDLLISGLVLASILYSLPFMVQPLATAFRSVSQETLEAAATLGASPGTN